MDVIVFKPKAFAALYFSLLKCLKMTTYAKAIYKYSTYKMLRILVSLQF